MATVYLIPNGAGYYNDFEAGGASYIWQCLDDPPGSPDEATTRADAHTGTDEYQSAKLGSYISGGVITDVTVTVRGISPGSTSAVRIFLRIGGVNYESANKTLPTAYGNITNSWATNPATGVAWTIDDLYALEAGARVITFGFPAISFTQLYATVTYTAPPVYMVDSTIFYGVRCGWQRVQKRRTQDGLTWQNYALHTWDIAQMEMSSFLILRGLQGQRVSLQTMSLADSRIGATYTSAEILSLSGEQTGQRMVNARVEFKADVS